MMRHYQDLGCASDWSYFRKFGLTNEKHNPDLGSDACLFLRCHFMGKPVEHEKTVDVAMPTNDPKETLFTL